MTHQSKINKSALLDCSTQNPLKLRCTVLKVLKVAPSNVSGASIARALTVDANQILKALNGLHCHGLVQTITHPHRKWLITDKGMGADPDDYLQRCMKSAELRIQTRAETQAAKFGDRSAKIREALSCISNASTAQLAEAVSLHPRCARSILIKMQDMGQLKMETAPRHGKQFWSLP